MKRTASSTALTARMMTVPNSIGTKSGATMSPSHCLACYSQALQNDWWMIIIIATKVYCLPIRGGKDHPEWEENSAAHVEEESVVQTEIVRRQMA